MNSLGYFTKQEVKYGMFIDAGHDLDLIIIDHLQYFTLANPKNELTEMTQILMKVKDITNHYKIPVILISHLRKKDKDRGLPSQEDFFGTSNIAKVSSQAITIASCYKQDNYTNGVYPTFFRFIKSRTGLRPSLGFLCDYCSKQGGYKKEYQIYKLIGDNPSQDPLDKAFYPSWASLALLKREALRQ
jgi:hypothetical protein